MSLRLFAPGLLFLWLLACRTQLYQDLSEQDANRVLEELARHNIPAKKRLVDARQKTWGIEVPDAEAPRAVSILSARDVVRPKNEGLAGFTRSSSILPSPEEQRIRYYVALGAELERTLMELPGVQVARVHLALPGTRMDFGQNAEKFIPTRASVMLKVRENEFELHPGEIQSLVAGALVDMPPAEVAVVIQAARGQHAPASDMVWFGPVLVSGTVRWILSGVLFLFLALGGVLAWWVMRLRRTVQRLSVPGEPTRARDGSTPEKTPTDGHFSGSH